MKLFTGPIIGLVACLALYCSLSAPAAAAPKSTTLTKALNFTLPGLDGKVHALSDYKGKVVFLNFWASWCPPCRAEMPSMQKLYSSWDKKKYVMLAVNLRETKEGVSSFARQNGYSFPILLDETGGTASQYQVSGIPTTFIIDGKGNIISRTVGSREWTLEALKKLIP